VFGRVFQTPGYLAPVQGQHCTYFKPLRSHRLYFSVAHQKHSASVVPTGSVPEQHLVVRSRLNSALEIPVEEMRLQGGNKEVVESSPAWYFLAPQHTYPIYSVAVVATEPLRAKIVGQTSRS
jgi:hypothetical protein